MTTWQALMHQQFNEVAETQQHNRRMLLRMHNDTRTHSSEMLQTCIF